MLYRNVCDAVDAPKVSHKPGKVWTAEEAQRFLAATEGDTLEPFWLVVVTTGLRRGEALGLRWADLDLDARILHVAQSVVVHKGAPVIQEPKSAAARRVVKLLPETVSALRAQGDAERAPTGTRTHLAR
jgi:integrase